MKIFFYLLLGSLTMCNAALLNSDQTQNSVEYSNEGEKEEIITIFEESDLNQNYQQEPTQNYLPPTSSSDEIIQTIKIIEELQPIINTPSSAHPISSSSSAHTEAHFPSVPSHQFGQHYSEQQSGFLPPIHEQQQEYLPPISESETTSGYLPPLGDSQPQHVHSQHVHSHQHQLQEYIPPNPHSVASQNDYLPPIQSQQEYLPPSPPAPIQPNQQYVSPVQQHSSAVHQPQQEYVPPTTSHQPAHFQTIRIIHESAAPASNGKTKFEAVKTLRIIKSFAPHHSEQHVKTFNMHHNQPKLLDQAQEIPKTPHAGFGNIRTKTLRIIHSSANPVVAAGHQAHQNHHTKTLKIIKNAASPVYNQHNPGATRTIRIIKQRAPVQSNGQYLSQGHAKKF